ncbi:MAG: hypothetical protein K0S65_6262 [Labilithrix sp.]|nr:hypothetical protein [Labilithrix sp.]
MNPPAEQVGYDSTRQIETLATPEDRLRALVDDHYDAIWRTLTRHGVPECDAEDAAQRVFLIAARKLGEVRPETERAYLHGIAFRIASDVRKSRSRVREVNADQLEDTRSDGPPPDARIEADEKMTILQKILDSLPRELRVVFVLSEIEEVKGTDIARILGLPEGTVASRLRRARTSFHEAAQRFRASRSGQ